MSGREREPLASVAQPNLGVIARDRELPGDDARGLTSIAVGAVR